MASQNRGNTATSTTTATQQGGNSSTMATTNTAASQNTVDRGRDEARFRRVVPMQFYIDEQSKFGPLPSYWEVGEKNGKKYFVNHKKKTTTWIDPRSKDTREHDVTRCQVGQLPYGWDEEVDDDFGVYYICHLLQSNFADPPWDPTVREQAAELQKYLDEQIAKSKKELEDLEKDEQDRIDAARRRVQELEEEKLRLEKELLELRQRALDGDVSESEVTESEISDRLSDIEDELDGLDPSAIPQSREDFQRRLQELMDLNKRLAMDQPGYDGIGEYKRTEQELEDVSNMLDREAEERARLEAQIMALKNEMENLYQTEGEPIPEPEEIDEGDEDAAARLRALQEDPNAKRKANLSRKTRYEMEVELLMLKKRIQAEKEEKARLENLKNKLQNARDNANQTGRVPVWIKQINEVAASSKTLRVKIGKQQLTNPDQLSFRERMLFFAAGNVDSNIKAPPTPARLPPKQEPQPKLFPKIR